MRTAEASARFHSIDRERNGQDQDAGKVVQQQRQQQVVLLVGRECHSDGCDMTSSVGRRPVKKLAGIDRRGLSVRTSLGMRLEECD